MIDKINFLALIKIVFYISLSLIYIITLILIIKNIFISQKQEYIPQIFPVCSLYTGKEKRKETRINSTIDAFLLNAQKEEAKKSIKITNISTSGFGGIAESSFGFIIPGNTLEVAFSKKDNKQNNLKAKIMWVKKEKDKIYFGAEIVSSDSFYHQFLEENKKKKS